MRYLIFLSLFFCTGCSHLAHDSWTGKDKTQHFIASAALFTTANRLSQHQHAKKADHISILFSLGLGLGKEAWDSRPAGSGWSNKDLTWDIAGTFVGFALWNLVD